LEKEGMVSETSHFPSHATSGLLLADTKEVGFVNI
jgi:hypothetical protein